MPKLSLNHTRTVAVPLEAVSVQDLVWANGLNAVQVVTLLMQTDATPLTSVADSVSVTVLDLVYCAAALITTEPVGPSNSGAGRAVVVPPVA